MGTTSADEASPTGILATWPWCAESRRAERLTDPKASAMRAKAASLRPKSSQGCTQVWFTRTITKTRVHAGMDHTHDKFDTKNAMRWQLSHQRGPGARWKRLNCFTRFTMNMFTQDYRFTTRHREIERRMRCTLHHEIRRPRRVEWPTSVCTDRIQYDVSSYGIYLIIRYIYI